MRLFLRYLAMRRGILLAGLAFAAVFAVSFWLFQLPFAAVLYPFLLCFLGAAVLLLADFTRMAKRIGVLENIRRMTGEMIDELPETADLEMEVYRGIIENLCHEIQEKQRESDRRYRDTVEYYTVWAHQIKTPIAAMRLTLQNEDTPLSRRLTGELFRIEQYVEMVMAFLRLDAEAGDYVFRDCDLDGLIKKTVRRFSGEFIDRKLQLSYTPTEQTVLTDEKWFGFCLEQLLSNALKYTHEGGISIFWQEPETLCIRDSGIGIAPEDLPRVFEKGYTGYNGRTEQSSSGIGLYLCRRICDKLGIGLSIESQVDTGTTVLLKIRRERLQTE